MARPHRTVALREGEHALIARQPILDRRGEVSGYELLARSADGSSGGMSGIGGDTATYRTVSNGFLLFGLDRLAHGKTAFINLTREVLFSEAVTALPARQVVLEILEDVVPDDIVVARCASLRRQGYRIALDDFADATLSNPLLDVADIVKVEFPSTTAYEQGALAEALKRRGIVSLAEKVEDDATYQRALRQGYDLFQGFFFCRPETLAHRDPGVEWQRYAEITRELARDELEFRRVEQIAKHDPGLSLRILTLANSAFYANREPIRSLHLAIVRLGERELRRWLWVIVLSEMGRTKPSALITLATARARFCELLAAEAGLRALTESFFLAGLFSLAPAILDRPNADILDLFQLAEPVKNALLGQAGEIRSALDVAMAFERAEWPSVERHAAALGVAARALEPLYASANSWADAPS